MEGSFTEEVGNLSNSFFKRIKYEGTFSEIILFSFFHVPLAVSKVEKAVFAGGCFWCMEPPYDKTTGVISTRSGYIGGKKAVPTDEEVSSGGTGHYEVVEVTYDTGKVSYKDLLTVFWKIIDP